MALLHLSFADPVVHQFWYAVHCRPFKEFQVARALHNLLDLTVYLPELRIPWRGQIRSTPLFPRYLFVSADLRGVMLSQINTTPGVSYLVAFDGLPQLVPWDVIEAIQAQVARLNTTIAAQPSAAPDDAKRDSGEAFRELDAVAVETMKPSERVRILLHILGRLRSPQMSADRPETGIGQARPKRARRTRGKGRKIRSNA